MRRVVMTLALSLALGCEGPGGEGEPPPTPTPDAKTEARANGASAPDPDAPETRAVPDWLARAVEHGIAAPPPGGSTYHVDPFVAALLLERARDGELPVSHLSEGDGAPGYRVGDVTPSGLLSRLGIESGDVIQSIDGTTLDSPDAVIPSLARTHTRVLVQVYREDFSMTLEYRLVGGMAWSRALAAVGSAMPTPPVLVDAAPAADPGTPEETGPEDPEATPGASRPAPPGTRKPTPPPAPGATRPRPAKPPGNGAPSGAVRCKSASQCEIDRASFDRLVQDPSRIESQATIVPAIRNDIQSGYKLKTVRPGSDVHALGFRGGDKITHINGHFLGDDTQAMQLYFKLPATRIFNVRYERGGQSRTKQIRVR